MKKLERSAELVLGVVRKEGERFWLSPVDKKERRELPITDLKDAQPGDLVLCEPSGGRRGSRRGSTRCSATRSRRAASA
jgi:ribonuclease R